MSLLVSAIGINIIILFKSGENEDFGRALVFFILITGSLHLTLRAIINVDTFMTSVERGLSIVNLEQEDDDIKPNDTKLSLQ